MKFDLEGRAYALETLSEVQLIKLYYQPITEKYYGNGMPKIPLSKSNHNIHPS